MSNTSKPSQQLVRFKKAAQKVGAQSTEHGFPHSTNAHPQSVVDIVNFTTENKKRETKRQKIFDQYKKVKKVYRALHLKHFGLVGVTLIYALLGGLIFSLLEGKHEGHVKQRRIAELNESAHNLSADVLALFNESVDKDLVVALIKDYQLKEGLQPKITTYWDFWGAMFFAGTVFTTIGYGHYVPVTVKGRIAVMIYALVGIPLVLAMLADLGKVVTKALNHLWTKFRRLERVEKLVECFKKRKSNAPDDQTSDDLDFPIPLALLLIVLWIFGCAAMFRFWETKWTYFEAFYFFFISLSTIGLGDLTPEHPKYMILNFPLVIFGLCLVTLVINLIQNKLEKLKEATTDFVEDQFGLDTDTESEDENANLSEEHHKVALGVIQTIQKVKHSRRRRIGVQTDESFLRDLNNRLMSESVISDGSVQKDAHRSLLISKKLYNGVTRDSDKEKLNSFDFYDS